ncbi:MAG: hypothetical protein ACREMS_05155, partial [Gemmatimonadaceae bacterium]
SRSLWKAPARTPLSNPVQICKSAHHDAGLPLGLFAETRAETRAEAATSARYRARNACLSRAKH